MKRLHLHVSVPDLAQSIQFYETLFGAEPSVVKDDYAKWMLDDPRVNFAISQRDRAAGVDHVGIQVDSAAELDELATRLKAAGATTFDQEATTSLLRQVGQELGERSGGGAVGDLLYLRRRHELRRGRARRRGGHSRLGLLRRSGAQARRLVLLLRSGRGQG